MKLEFFISDLLKKSRPGGRIIFTTSLICFIHMLTAENVRKYGIKVPINFLFYPTSKFCQLSASETFSIKLKKYGITSNVFHPYSAKTSIFKSSCDGAKWYEYLYIYPMRFLAQLTAKVKTTPYPVICCVISVLYTKNQYYFID